MFSTSSGIKITVTIAAGTLRNSPASANPTNAKMTV
jgi:hypothetical protein